MMEPFDDRATSDQYLFLPSRAGQAALAEFERRNNTALRFSWGVPCMEDYLVPMMPGDLVSLVARPGMGKTTAMIHLARVANHLLCSGVPEAEGGYVVYCTWETMVEEFVAIQNAYHSGVTLQSIGRGQADMQALERSIAASIDQRIAVIGQSVKRDRNGGRGRRMRPPTLAEVDEILWEMEESIGIKPSLLLLDYLQRIPSTDPKRDRSLVVSENLERCKDLATGHGVPVVVGVQAKRDIDEYKGLKLAGMSDGQWTSNIEQTCDKVLSMSRPKFYMKEGEAIEDDSIDADEGGYIVSDRTLAMRVVKQRWADAGRTFILDMDPARSTISDATRLEVVY